MKNIRRNNLSIESMTILSIMLIAGLLTTGIQAQSIEITDLKVTNYTGTAFGVSWRTSVSTSVNQVVYGLDRENLDRTQSQTESDPSGLIHYVQLTFLNQDTTYYYRVVSDGKVFTNSETGLDSVRTRQQTPSFNFALFYGNVTDQFNNPLQGVLVRSFLRWSRTVSGQSVRDSTLWRSSLSDADGNFSEELQNYRTSANSAATYNPGSTWMVMEFLGTAQGITRDSVLLTSEGSFPQQYLGVFQIIDETKKATHGQMHATTPVLADGNAASVVRIRIIDENGSPIPNVNLVVTAGGNGATVTPLPSAPTNANGETFALVRSTIDEAKAIRALNISADSVEIDTFVVVNFVDSLTSLSEDTVKPFIISVNELDDTEDNVGPYEVIARAVDNYKFKTYLVYSTTGHAYTDTVQMNALGSPGSLLSDTYRTTIPGQPYNTIVRYFIMAVDSSGNKSSYPSSMLESEFGLPLQFSILPDTDVGNALMGINLTTDAFSTFSTARPVRIDTWVSTIVGIMSASIKWRNTLEGSAFREVKMKHFGSHFWGDIPAVADGGLIEYYIQAVDSLGRVEKDRRRTPTTDLFSYEVVAYPSGEAITYVDTTAFIGTTNVSKSRHAAIGDLNGDDYPDIVTADYGGLNEVYFYYPGVGRLQRVTTSVFPGQPQSKSTAVALLDFDADDDLDVVFANENAQNRLYMNLGNGTFEDVTNSPLVAGGSNRMPEVTTLSNTTCVLAQDFNGDGCMDIFFTNGGGDGGVKEQNRMYINDSLGVFRDWTTRSNFNAVSPDLSVWAVAGDVDGDFDTDIIVINRADKHYLWKNNGRGIFQFSYIAEGSAALAKSAELADLDGDGDLDLVIAQSQNQRNELYINDGSGNFSNQTDSRLPLESDDTRYIKAFDADSDGFMDLYLANYGQLNRLWLNNGSGVFSEAPGGMMPTWGSHSMSVAVGDINRDMHVDVYVTEEDRRNTLLFNRPFTALSGLPTSFQLSSPADNAVISPSNRSFYWHPSFSTSSGGQITYALYISRDSLFSTDSIVVQQAGISDTTLSVNLSDFDSERLYWWRVDATNSLDVAVQSEMAFSFNLSQSGENDIPAPEFAIFVNRNPVFESFMNIFVLSSVPLSGNPSLKINLNPVSASRQGTADIWKTQYKSRTSMFITVSGTNEQGLGGADTVSYGALLSSAGSALMSTPDGKVSLAFTDSYAAGNAEIIVRENRPITDHKLKSRMVQLASLAEGFSAADIELLSEGGSYSFVGSSADVAGGVRVMFKAAGFESGMSVCVLENGEWQALGTTYDSAENAYVAYSDKLGTFALRSTGIGGSVSLPKAFSLKQNAPNPFNPSTTIGYSVPDNLSDNRLSIMVYNIRGQSVATLIDKEHVPGSYSVHWNGRDNMGRDVPSGVYFYRLRSGSQTITRKMVLIR